MEKKIVKSANEAAEQIIEWGESHGIETCFDRAQRLKPCPIGAAGACCKTCHMGPCRFVGKNAEEEARGVCGATLPTVASRNLLRMAIAGSAAHTDHARDMAFILLAVANGETSDFRITDVRKLYKVAGILDIEFGNGMAVNDVARDVALRLIKDFGRQKGELNYIKRAPNKTQERWKKWGITPRGIDREITEAMHRTHMGVDHAPDNLLLSALRVSLADGWGGSMISTDITDILFGTPRPVKAEAGFGIFKEDEVNIVVHGHEPSLAEMIVDVVNEPEMIAYAKSKGAKGINLGGMCCTANEVLMRHGIPTAGGFTNQELAIMTGLIDAITVDVQCIMPALVELSRKFHTKVITTSYKAKIPGAVHIEYDEHRAKEIAREIVKFAIDNYPNRKAEGIHINQKFPVIAGFSHEYIEYMQGGRWRASFRPLNDAIMAGRIRGVVGLAGCDNPRVPSQGLHRFLAVELIKNDVLILSTGCGSHACGTAGYLIPEMALENAGPGLREVCEAIGVPPILHLGSCVDNSRILTIVSAMAAEGGLSDEIGGMPVVGIAPEWMSEKAISIGCYLAASGVPVIFGGESPVSASEEVTKIMTEVWFERFKGALHFEPDPEKILSLTLEYIDRAREALKLRKYEPGKFGAERVLLDMAARRELEKAAKPHIGIY
ncbi:MAG: carbon-monoxide dehydrogenase catalytic subunit [Nitrospirae bacterium CG_4_10_14_0_8_um_filter_41_23]|nr:anaerobic carbon-monoxide dehydrogenase catalytic subunit [Nitrospirota bacterium]OIP59241.1 MAG: carbon-monoxide dehydrogenase catalytic subunit [Nitrospirae bacterium CG2_30_41_42]PIQ94345.1 MAG: carbon-monoxide dehydrogenase catalytic subunit [Nitrospirae bacterium CG11_big_fil_rev_8_21_14_0_20_41_14]PIV44150.1 MAG: carbon-monoxide dehydrogenase catalytic subunit [Nitrospirae bacterium CG02_land_8_20_14_3_00_41_53]PIW87277.1 MAG: carbon-monoxide dehydrogenase catalytic subunit [Nitrospira